MITKAYIFDLYNTLVYTHSKNSIYKKHFQALHLDDSESKQLRNLIMTQNFSFKELENLINTTFNKEFDSALLEKELKQEISLIKCYEDTIPYLEAKKKEGYKLGLISNLATPYKEAVKNLDLEKYFDYITFSCDVGYQKPQKEIYYHTLLQLKLQSQQAIMIGDSKRNDFDAPTSLGMYARHLQRDKGDILNVNF